MYYVVVLLLLLVFPLASVATQSLLYPHAFALMSLIGRWFVFWAVGIRLFIAGLRQVIQPQFTASEIFDIHDPGALPMVREIGFANLSMGLLGIWSVARAGWIVPAAIVGGLYYGLAGAGHLGQKSRNAKENTAMVSDVFVFLILFAFVLHSLA